MEYSYRLGSFEGKHISENRESDKGKRSGLTFALCVAAALTVCGARLAFPAETAEFLENAGAAIKYEEALETLGKIVAGDVETPPQTQRELPSEETPAVDEYTVFCEEETEFETVEIPIDGESYNEAMVKEFTEKQAVYKDYGVPTKASYDMPELGFDYICPVIGPVTSSFGYRVHPNDKVVRFHYGTDLGVPEGTEIVSFADGKVKAVGNSSSYGKYVMIEHEGSAVSMFAHCSKICVSEGTEVLKGDKVAESGSTGNATGDCVHFEIIVNGKYVNPEYYVSWN